MADENKPKKPSHIDIYGTREEWRIAALNRHARALEDAAMHSPQTQVPAQSPPAKRKGYQPPARLNCNQWLIAQYDFDNGSTDDKTFYTERVDEWQRIRKEQDVEAEEKTPLSRKKDREKALTNMRATISKARKKRGMMP